MSNPTSNNTPNISGNPNPGNAGTPWYNSSITGSKSLRSSMFKNINDGMVDGNPVAPKTGRNVGAFRSSLQWRKDTAGGLGTLAGNASSLRGDMILNAQRLKYGNLRWDSPEAQAILQKTGDQLTNLESASSKTLIGILSDLTDNNISKLLGAIVGGSGTGGNTAKDEFTAIKNLLFNKLDFRNTTKENANEKIADDVDATSEKSIISNLGEAAMGLFSQKTLEKISGMSISTGFKGIQELFAKGGKYITDKFGTAAEWVKDSLLFGIPLGAVIKASNRIGGKILGYCLKMTDVYSSGNGGAKDASILRSRVMNLPPAMTDIIDPNGRVYNNNVIACQHILSIIPGTLDYDGFKWVADSGITNAAIASELSAFENDNQGSIIFNASSALASILDMSDKTGRRLGIFKPEVMKFSRVYMTAMGRILSRLSPSPAVTMTLDKTVLQTTGWGAFEIGIGTNTTLTESGSNSFTNSLFDEMMNGTSSKVLEITKTIKSVIGSKHTASEYESDSNSAVDAVLHGNKLNTPKFWENSDFSRSYTFNFRLESPYGDTESVINYVYKPFIALLCCALPISVSTYGYTSPFVIRADCPGWFSIDCGYVSSIDFRRAPDEGTFNASGLATAIEVTMSITDIYPALALSVGVSGLSKNFGEQSFLDSLSGMDYKEIYSGGSFASRLRSRIVAVRTMPGIIGNAAVAKASRAAWGFSITGLGAR